MTLLTFEVALAVLVLLLIFVQLCFLTNVIGRAVNALEKVARTLDRPRRERAALEHELDDIGEAAAAGMATTEDMERANAIEAKLERKK